MGGLSPLPSPPPIPSSCAVAETGGTQPSEHSPLCSFSVMPGLKSGLLADTPTFLTALSSWLGSVGYQGRHWAPCYRAIHDGWSDEIYHEKCDNRGPFVVIFRRDSNSLVGGYSDRELRESEYKETYRSTSFPGFFISQGREMKGPGNEVAYSLVYSVYLFTTKSAGAISRVISSLSVGGEALRCTQ